jgi:acetylornithine deacetylase/succinyl-diaminopimelate desuccinylase-like protein
VKIVFVIEGEEELGSPNLEAFCKEYNHYWQNADLCIWEAGGVNESDNPYTYLGLKGMLYLEILAMVGVNDMHSREAVFFESAAWKLIEFLNLLRKPDGQVDLPGFYDSIEKPNDFEQKLLADSKFDSGSYLKQLGRTGYIKPNSDEELNYRKYYGATCNISGISAGSTKPGEVKTILVAEARVKLDFRLVPNQDPVRILESIRMLIKDNSLDKEITIESAHYLYPAKTDANDLLIKAIKSIESSYQKPIDLQVTHSGSGPLNLFTDYNKKMSLLCVGALYPGRNVHAPDENIRIQDYLDGLKAFTDLLVNL